VTPLVALIAIYSLGLIVFGAWIGRHVRRTADFFVAGRSLGAGLLFATFLAANIGAGSTVGATGYAYTDGMAAWWWNGSAGVGSLVLAFWVGPRVWRAAKDHGFMTVGDFLEHHFGRGVRGVAALMIWLGSFFILCGQIRGAAEVLQRAGGFSFATGAFLASVVAAAYFVAGGLLSAAWVNRVQLVVIVAGFAIAAPLASGPAGGLGVTMGDTSFWRGPNVGWPTLFLLGPAFFLSPGLIQKAYGARSERVLTRGVALNGIALMAFACFPVLLGLAARSLHPGLARPEMALPAVLAEDVPTVIGSIALAAVFSAELSSADAVLFMLATSGARDFYRGFIRPHASDAEVLRVARWLAIAGCLIGFLLTFLLDSVVSALTMFYSLMVVTLFAPILGGLFLPRGGRWGALASMLVGVTTLAVTHLASAGQGYGWATPSFLGLISSGITYLILAAF
jgi:solute:Na+ symporter, SSS family